MRGLGILILIVMFFWLIWPVLSRWLKRKAMEKAEDYMRSSMGMPPRDKKRNSGRKQENRTSGQTYYRTGGQNSYSRQNHGPIIPKEYAEDVEFTETIDYSQTESRYRSGDKIETYHESQISDAEWIEIKKPRSKQHG